MTKRLHYHEAPHWLSYSRAFVRDDIGWPLTLSVIVGFGIGVAAMWRFL